MPPENKIICAKTRTHFAILILIFVMFLRKELGAFHLKTEGVTMEASCTVLVLERTTGNSIYYY